MTSGVLPSIRYTVSGGLPPPTPPGGTPCVPIEIVEINAISSSRLVACPARDGSLSQIFHASKATDREFITVVWKLLNDLSDSSSTIASTSTVWGDDWTVEIAFKLLDRDFHYRVFRHDDNLPLPLRDLLSTLEEHVKQDLDDGDIL